MLASRPKLYRTRAFATTLACLLVILVLSAVAFARCTSEKQVLLGQNFLCLVLTVATVSVAVKGVRMAQQHYEQPTSCLDACCIHAVSPPPPPPPPLPVTPAPPPKKRKRLANVRKGCIAKRPDRTKSKPGPKPNPKSKRSLLKVKRSAAKILCLEEKLSIKQCIWRTSNHGGQRRCNSEVRCCVKGDCYRQYREAAGGGPALAGIIMQYRKYYHSLTYDGQREWWNDHTLYTGYAAFEASAQTEDDRTLRRGGRYHSSRCEIFASMRSSLATTKPDDKLRPCEDSKMRPVCSKFLQFVVAGHHDTKDQHSIRKHVFSVGSKVTPEDLDVGIPSKRSQKSPPKNKDAFAKKVDVTNWLFDQGQLSLLDPADGYAVLPYRSCADTHAHYIFDQEVSLNKPWAAEVQSRALRARGTHDQADECVESRRISQLDTGACAGDDEHIEDESAATDIEQEEAILQKEHRERKLYRYGNRLCGLKSEDRPEDPNLATLSYFNKVWRQDPLLITIICREHMPFAKCDFCIKHRAKAERKRTKEAIEEDNAELRLHLQDIKAEKMMYYSNRARARRSPRMFLSIIIDGADQSKHDMPHFKDTAHLIAEIRRIKMHLYGALVHGRGAYAFTIPDHEPQGHNTTIQVLHHILCDLKKEGPLPKVLKLQVDNTTKQNKGQYLYGYLDLLVEYGVFESVEVSFLPVGHTHEDIDQFFSRISVWLRYKRTRVLVFVL
jgi:hypothetical protein